VYGGSGIRYPFRRTWERTFVHLHVGLLGGLLRETLVGAPGLVLGLVLQSQSAGLLDVHIANGGLLEETVELQELGIGGLLGELLGEFRGFFELFGNTKLLEDAVITLTLS